MISAKLKPARNPKLKFYQKDGSVLGSIDGKSFVALPDLIFGTLALCNGKTSVDEIAFHLSKNSPLTKEDMLMRLEDVMEILLKNKFVTKSAPGKKGKKK